MKDGSPLTLAELPITLQCPRCGSPLQASDDGGWRCGEAHAWPLRDDGRPDFRLREPIQRRVDFTIGEAYPDLSELDLRPLEPAPQPAVDFAGVDVPRHLSRAMLSRFPRAEAGQVALDLGCGDAIHRGVTQRAGFDYVGLDYVHDGAPILGDAHALPFADDVFDFVLSVAVLEHIRYPFVMIEEAARVMKPGATLIGTVAFLEPWHDNSFFHHSHLGLANVLLHAGLEVEAIAPHAGWSVLRSQARTLYPGLPRRMAEGVVAPLHALHRMWYWPVGLKSPRHEVRRRLKTSGAFTFIARQP